MDAPPRPVRYALAFFYQRALMLLAIFVFVLLLLGLQTNTPSEWLMGATGVLVAYLFVVGLSPMLTKHTLTRSRIILRQGWYFRCVLPFSDAESIGPFDGEPKYGLRLSPSRGILFVVGGGRNNLISVRLREPRRFAQALFFTAQEIVFDVDDREAFLAAVTERKTAGKPLAARKIPMLPPARP